MILSIKQNTDYFNFNIKYLNEKLNYDKINALLVDWDINDHKRREIKKYETKLKALREIDINDFVKRQKFMTDLVSHIHNEKETFFDIIEKNENKDKNKDIIFKIQ